MVDRLQAPRVVDEPQECFVKLRVVTGGPWVGARIYRCLGMLLAEINLSPADPFQVWHGGDLIDEATYEILTTPPLLNPFIPVHVSDRGLADAMRTAGEMDRWWADNL